MDRVCKRFVCVCVCVCVCARMALRLSDLLLMSKNKPGGIPLSFFSVFDATKKKNNAQNDDT
jgi:hypothetical protein